MFPIFDLNLVALRSSLLHDGWWFKHAQASQVDTLILTCQSSKPNEITKKKKNSVPPIVLIRGEGSVTGHRFFSELLEWLGFAFTLPSDMFLLD